ncbi:MAG: hypothetical protein V1725_00020 [archaeon]
MPKGVRPHAPSSRQETSTLDDRVVCGHWYEIQSRQQVRKERPEVMVSIRR